MTTDWVRISERLSVNLQHVAAVSQLPDGKVVVYFPGPMGPDNSTYATVDPARARSLLVKVGMEQPKVTPQTGQVVIGGK